VLLLELHDHAALRQSQHDLPKIIERSGLRPLEVRPIVNERGLGPGLPGRTRASGSGQVTDADALRARA
jgi:hypothetical protein